MTQGTNVDPGWQEQVLAAWEDFAEERLGPDISDDARRYCPVETGALKASIEHHMEGDDLIVSASGGGEDDEGNLYVSRRPGRHTTRSAALVRPMPVRDARKRTVGVLDTREVHHVDEGGRTYAAYVELGHRIYHPSTGQTGPGTVAPRPFLRPALYQERHD
jgi:hypothetical protein